MNYLEVYYLVSKHLELFLFSSLISGLITLWFEHTLYDFSSFKFIEVSFVPQNMVYLGICSLGI